MKKTVRTNKGGWFSVAVALIMFGGMFLFSNKENIKSAFTVHTISMMRMSMQVISG